MPITRNRRSLSFDEFFAATKGMRISEALKVAAHNYMVEGQTFESIAKRTGLNDRSIQRSVRSIWFAHRNASGALPEGWVREQVALPSDEMQTVQKHSKKLLEQIYRSD